MNTARGKRLLYALLLLPALGMLGVGSYMGVEYATAEGDWQTWVAERKALGDRFDLKDLIQAEVPDADNFAMAKPVVGTFQSPGAPSPFEGSGAAAQAMGDWTLGQRADLEACAKAYQAKNLLTALAPFQQPLKELETASHHLYSRLPYGNLEDQPRFYKFGTFTSALRALSQRALANLAQGNMEAASKDVLTSLRVTEYPKAEPFLLAALVRTTMVGIAVQPIWEGLIDHRWNDAQLAKFQAHLQQVDLLITLRLANEAKRSSHIAQVTHDVQVPSVNPLETDKPMPGSGQRLLPRWVKRAILYRDLLECDRFIASTYLDSIHPETHRVFPERWAQAQEQIERLKRHKDFVALQKNYADDLIHVQHTARIQTLCDLAAIACALERHRLAKGAYPDTLEELSPAFMAQMPRDIVNGQPYHYHYQPQATKFLLYGLGWAGKDEGGQRPGALGSPSLDYRQGNWAWMALAK